MNRYNHPLLDPYLRRALAKDLNVCVVEDAALTPALRDFREVHPLAWIACTEGDETDGIFSAINGTFGQSTTRWDESAGNPLTPHLLTERMNRKETVPCPDYDCQLTLLYDQDEQVLVRFYHK